MIEYDWKKIGMIYEAGSDNEFLLTHASNPLPLHISGNLYRIFYSGRDNQNRSSVSYVDYDISSLTVVEDPKEPILKYGPEDSFYSHGITLGNSWQQKGETYIGFMGWQHRENAHWRGDIGKFNINTKKVSLLLGKNDVDKVSLSYPCVVEHGTGYRMWYGSTISWGSKSFDNEMIHTINYADSNDGEKWSPMGLAIPWKLNVAQAFSKPSVLKYKDTYRMWYSYRKGDGSKYKIGYSYSQGGTKWNFSESKIKTSSYGWDSEMVCYPYVFMHKEKTYMLYNGNSFGKYGFGLAIQKEEKNET